MIKIRAIAVGVFLVSSAQAADLPDAATTTLAACRGGIEEWAAQFSPISLNVQPTRAVETTDEGTRTAQLFVQVVYDTQGGPETREATIDCTVDASGEVAVAEASS